MEQVIQCMLLIFRVLCLLAGEDADDLLYCEGILDTEYAAAATLQRVKMRSAAECLAKVARKGPHIRSLAAGHPDRSVRKTQR